VVGLWVKFMMFTDILVVLSLWLLWQIPGVQYSEEVGLLGGLLDGVQVDGHLLDVEAHVVGQETVYLLLQDL
jgi:hypothetical protein